MSGVRLHNPRQGDRSEYLAVYMLSALGLVTQVPRQEDIGIDLICNLAEQESGIVGFRHHFAVSVKSASTPRAVFVPADSKKDDPKYTDHFNRHRQHLAQRRSIRRRYRPRPGNLFRRY